MDDLEDYAAQRPDVDYPRVLELLYQLVQRLVVGLAVLFLDEGK